MTLMHLRATWHLRGEQTGTDRYGRPVYGAPRDVDTPAWWEALGADEDSLRGDIQTTRYRLYVPESAPPSGADAVTLHGSAGDERCELVGSLERQPEGFEVPGYATVVVQRVSG